MEPTLLVPVVEGLNSYNSYFWVPTIVFLVDAAIRGSGYAKASKPDCWRDVVVGTSR